MAFDDVRDNEDKYSTAGALLSELISAVPTCVRIVNSHAEAVID